MNTDTEMARLAERQHGLVARFQVHELGASKAYLYRRSRGPDWSQLTDRVLRRAGAPPTAGQLAMAAVLDAGPQSWLSHSSAAAWWGLSGFHVEPVHVSRRKGVGRRRSTLAIVHEVTDIEGRHVTVLGDVPVARPELVAYHLCGSVHPMRAERAVDNAWRNHLLSGRSLRAVLDDLAEQGRNGTTLLREILERRGDDYVPPASNLEARYNWLLTDAGERPMRRQVDVGSGTYWVGRVDFVDEELPLVAEILSEKYHTALLDKEADAARFAALKAAGFMVLTFWDTEVWQKGPSVVARVRAARQALRRGAG